MVAERAGLLAVTVLALTGPLTAQRRLDLYVGRWERAGADPAVSFALRSSGHLLGPINHGLAAQVFVDEALGRRRAFYGVGYELTAWRASRGFAFYPVAGMALGLSTDTTDQALALMWSAGVGFEWRPVGPLAVGVELRYRVEDRGPRGIWALDEHREGWGVAAGLTFLWHGGGGGGRNESLPPRRPDRITGSAAPVVETALQVVGTPYAWGGSAANGYDCSGLVHYVYARHGVRLPRTSRDQSSAGEPVPPVLEALVPGDILLFSARPGGGVTHVGLYVGNDVFIHSASEGVKLSRLVGDDPEGKYWVPRWVGVRRIIP